MGRRASAPGARLFSPSSFSFLFPLLLLALLLAGAWGQPGPANNDTAPGTTTVDQVESQLKPYAAAIGGVIAALGVILGTCVRGVVCISNACGRVGGYLGRLTWVMVPAVVCVCLCRKAIDRSVDRLNSSPSIALLINTHTHIYIYPTTAFAGKSILRLYLAVVGFLFGAFTSYVVLERVAASGQSLGPNKEIIQLVVAIVAGAHARSRLNP